MTKQKAQEVLKALTLEGEDKRKALDAISGVGVFGNKGRAWSQTACITNLDTIKGQCNPRLSFNYANVEDIGCPECLATLTELAK